MRSFWTFHNFLRKTNRSKIIKLKTRIPRRTWRPEIEIMKSRPYFFNTYPSILKLDDIFHIGFQHGTMKNHTQHFFPTHGLLKWPPRITCSLSLSLSLRFNLVPSPFPKIPNRHAKTPRFSPLKSPPNYLDRFQEWGVEILYRMIMDGVTGKWRFRLLLIS